MHSISELRLQKEPKRAAIRKFAFFKEVLVEQLEQSLLNEFKNHTLDLKSIRRIAVMRMSAMGDCILLQPTVLRILKHCPHVEIDWFIDKAWASLFPKIERLNLIPIPKPRSIKDYLTLKNTVFNQEYDILLAMQASFRSNLMYTFIKAPLKIGFDKKRARDGQWLWTNARIQAGEDHLCDGFARFADALNIPEEPKLWNIVTAESNELPDVINQTVETGRPIIGILPAASKLERTPEPSFWAAFLESWKEQLEPGRIEPLFVILGGPSATEAELAQDILNINAGSVDMLNFAGKTSLPVLAGIIKQLQVLISPDSGPAHLANALHTPVIGLYAVAPSKLSGPYNFRHLTFDCYEEAVEKYLGLSVENTKWGTRVHNRAAMSLIEPSAVVARTLEVLKVAGVPVE
ncbi:MAG TPA: hypothetical protein DDW29_12455 [Gammaproteobacteria bacterium]|nr:hypothetical protein [Gammaproteobacteria bacterium]|tara:strand:+ start:28042 stop:29256 length:1215 start_codon:yes stop_codon:yes gene_type:complete